MHIFQVRTHTVPLDGRDDVAITTGPFARAPRSVLAIYEYSPNNSPDQASLDRLSLGNGMHAMHSAGHAS